MLYFLSKVPIMFNYQEGRDVFRAMITLYPEIISGLTHKQLFSEKLFFYLCFVSEAVVLIYKLFSNKNHFYAKFDPNMLFSRFMFGYNAFALLCASEAGITLLSEILAGNQRAFEAMTPQIILQKNKFIAKPDMGLYDPLDAKIDETTMQNKKIIALSPFHQLAVSTELGVKLLYCFMGAIKGVSEIVTLDDLCGTKNSISFITLQSPIYHICNMREGIKFLNTLFAKNPNLLLSIPAEAFFEAPMPMRENCSIQPAVYQLMLQDDGIEFFSNLLIIRADLIKHFVICLSRTGSGLDRTLMAVLTRTDTGRELLLALTKDHRALCPINWDNFCETFTGITVAKSIDGVSAFYYLLSRDHERLAELFRLVPELPSKITAATLFASPFSTLVNSHSAFVIGCLDAQKQLLLLKIFKAQPALVQDVNAMELVNKVTVKNLETMQDERVCIAVMLDYYPGGRELLQFITQYKPGLKRAIEKAIEAEGFKELTNFNSLVR